MRTKKYRCIVAATVMFLMMLLNSCEDGRWLNNMVNDQVFLLKSGYVKDTIYNQGDVNYEIFVEKSGVGQQEANLEISIDENLLSEYNDVHNTNYKVLPQDYYSIKDSTLHLKKEDSQGAFQVYLDAARIIELETTTHSEYVLPFKVNKLDSIESKDSSLITIVNPEFRAAYMSLSQIGSEQAKQIITPKSDEQKELYYEVTINYYNPNGVTFKFEKDQSLIDKYNKRYGTKYLMLPDSAYKFDEGTFNILPKMNYRLVKLTLYQKEFLNTGQLGNYFITIRLTTPSIFDINPQKCTLLIPVIFSD